MLDFSCCRQSGNYPVGPGHYSRDVPVTSNEAAPSWVHNYGRDRRLSGLIRTSEAWRRPRPRLSFSSESQPRDFIEQIAQRLAKLRWCVHIEQMGLQRLQRMLE